MSEKLARSLENKINNELRNIEKAAYRLGLLSADLSDLKPDNARAKFAADASDAIANLLK